MNEGEKDEGRMAMIWRKWKEMEREVKVACEVRRRCEGGKMEVGVKQVDEANK